MKKTIKSVFDLIIFDVDDTLLPVMGPVMDAHHAQMKFLSGVLDEPSFQFVKEHLTKDIRRSLFLRLD